MPIHKRLYRRLESRPTRTGLTPGIAIARYGSRYAIRGTYSRTVFYAGFLPPLIFSLILYVSTRNPDLFSNLARFLLRRPDISGPQDLDPGMWRELAGLALNQLLFFESWIAVLVTGFVGSKQIADDMRSQAFEVYLTRPIRAVDYLVGKLLVVMRPLVLITWIPVAVFGIATVAFLDGAMSAAWPTYVRALGAGLFIAFVNGMAILGVSSLTSSSRYALVIWFCLYFVSLICFGILFGTTNDPGFAHVAYRLNIDIVVQKILGIQGRDLFDPERLQEHELGPAVLLLGTIVLLSAALVLRRVRRGKGVA